MEDLPSPGAMESLDTHMDSLEVMRLYEESLEGVVLGAAAGTKGFTQSHSKVTGNGYGGHAQHSISPSALPPDFGYAAGKWVTEEPTIVGGPLGSQLGSQRGGQRGSQLGVA